MMFFLEHNMIISKIFILNFKCLHKKFTKNGNSTKIGNTDLLQAWNKPLLRIRTENMLLNTKYEVLVSYHKEVLTCMFLKFLSFKKGMKRVLKEFFIHRKTFHAFAANKLSYPNKLRKSKGNICFSSGMF